VARSAVSDEEIQLRKRARRRLVGAVALVLLVVAAVPMILDSEPRQPAHRIEVQVPPMPQRPPSQPAPAPAVTAPAPTMNATSPASTASPPAPANTAALTPAPGPLPTPPVAAAEQQPTTAGESPAARAAAPKTSSTANARAEKSTASANTDTFAVALIATASTTKAAALKRELQRQKFPAYTQTTPDGDKTRVRVGPYSSREAAEQARQRLIKQGYDPGKVVRQGD
jgi:DedD protein